jgi:pyruvate/2-oxoglutarate dehydrogenase complex dihydrolipoamide acyltransferase (E2) component
MAKVDVVMPQMGESVMEGTVIQWTRRVGDLIQVDDTLLEIATDKVDTEVPSPEAGVLVAILAQEGETIEVGKPIAVIETDPSAAGTVASAPVSATAEPASSAEPALAIAPTAAAPAPAPPVPEPDSTTAAASASAASPAAGQVVVVMPQMGESVMEGTIIEWSKKIGDKVDVDEPLLEIATDKVDTEVPSPEAGVLVEIRAQAGETIQVGQPIAVIATSSSAQGAIGTVSSVADQAPAPVHTQAAAPMPVAEPAAVAAPAPTVQPATNGHAVKVPRLGISGRFYSPLVRSIAEKEGIPVETLDRIPGSGQNGRLTKSDLMGFLTLRPPVGHVGATKPSGAATPAAAASAVTAPAAAGTSPASGLTRPGAPAAAASAPSSAIQAGELSVAAPRQSVEIIKMDRMRKMIADHMVKSKQTSAHVTTFADVDVTNLVRWRNASKDRFAQQTGVKLTFTPLFVEAIIQAIREFPLINSSVSGDEIHVKRDINFGLAVALGEGGRGGLIVPVIKQAQEKNLVGLADAINDLATKARTKTLSPDDLVGGTITLTNYGSVGNLMGTPIINQPQVAIIGTGVIEKRPVVLETEVGDVIAIRHMMYLSMSYDHRIIDGAHGGAFLNRIKTLLESTSPDRTF